MTPHPNFLRPFAAHAPGASRRRHRLQPRVDGLEDRTVLSAILSHEPAAIHAIAATASGHADAAAAHHHQPHGRSQVASPAMATPIGAGHAHHHGRAMARAAHLGAGHAAPRHHHHRHHAAQAADPPSTPTASPSSTATDPPPATAAPVAPGATSSLTPALSSMASATSTGTSTNILDLKVGPLDLNLLGLEVQLYGQDASSPVTVDVSAQPGSGELLGNLLGDVGGLLNTQVLSNTLDNVLSNVVNLANQASLSLPGSSGSGSTTTGTTQVLDAHIAPVHLNLLGALVDTSPINLVITAHSGQGQLLGNLVADLANLLNNPTGNLVKDVESGLSNMLGQLDRQFPNIPPASTTSTAASTTTGTTQVLSLSVPPIDLNLLGLILQTSQIQVNLSAQSGNGDLLGNLVSDLLNTAHVTQTDLNTIGTDLNDILAKVVGVLNAATLTLPSDALSSLSPALQMLASPTLVNTSGGTVAPQPVLDLNIASTSSNTPPVDVNLLGVVVTTSNIQVQLSARPGQGQLLGNLVYNVSHLLDGNSLALLSLLGSLGI